MKKSFILLALAASISFTGCSLFGGKSDEGRVIDYLAVKVTEKEDWGFVDAKGNIVSPDQFTYEPSAVVEGVFHVWESNDIVLYKFDKKKHIEILSGLSSAGLPCNGLIPICKKGSKIEVVNLDGKTQFEIPNEIDGKAVISCAQSFKEGYLIVNLKDNYGDNYQCLLDDKGKVILGGDFKAIDIISSNLFYTWEEIDDEDKQAFYNAKKEEQKQWKLDEDAIVRVCDGKIIVENSDRSTIYDLKGNQILKCPEYVKAVIQISGKHIVYYGENGYGALTMKGEKLVSDKYYDMTVCNGQFYAVKDSDHDAEILNSKGEQITTSDFRNIIPYKGFTFLGMTSRDRYCIVDSKGKEINHDEYYEIGESINREEVFGICHICGDGTDGYEVMNDFFDYNAIAQSVAAAIKSGLQERGYVAGNTLGQVYDYSIASTSGYNVYDRKFNFTLAEGLKHSLTGTALLKDRVLAPEYGSKPYQEWDWWAGRYVTRYKTVVTGYKINEKAVINEITLKLEVPSDKLKDMNKKIREVLSSQLKSLDTDFYEFNGVQVVADHNGYDTFTFKVYPVEEDEK